MLGAVNLNAKQGGCTIPKPLVKNAYVDRCKSSLTHHFLFDHVSSVDRAGSYDCRVHACLKSGNMNASFDLFCDMLSQRN
eukprot:g3522.t1